MRLPVALVAAACALHAETHTLTLRQAVDRAQKQNPDIVLARLDEQRAAEQVRIARDPFTPRLVVGSGLAYTNGFPMSIEGSAPSVFRAQAIQSLYNRPLSFEVAAARENARGASIDVAARRQEVLHRIASMHLAGDRARRISDLLQQQIASFERIAATVRARVEEGRELPVEARAAELRLAVARQRLRSAQAELESAERSLAVALGYPPEDRVSAAADDEFQAALPESENAAVDEALQNSVQVRRLESAIQARQLQAQAARAARWPQVDLVAQYSLMARFNNYEEFFQRFQRNNGQIGVSLQLPLFTGSATKAREAQAEIDMMRLRTELNAARDRLAIDARRAWQDVLVAESAREVARMDLEVTRERLNVALAQLEEGRITLRQVEELRTAELEKWQAFHDAQHAMEQARLDLLRATGALTSALR